MASPDRLPVCRICDATDGLEGGVTGLLQDSRGLLWIGTRIGLYRYDGVQFHLVYASEASPDITHRTLVEDGDGRIWFALGGMHDTRGHGVVGLDPDAPEGEPVRYTAADGLPDDHVRALCVDTAGRLWFGGGSGIAVLDGGVVVPCARDTVRAVRCMVCDARGRIWCAAAGDGVYVVDPAAPGRERVQRFTTSDGLLPNRVHCVAVDGSGGVWVGYDGDAGLSCYDGDRWRHRPAVGAVLSIVECIRPDASGALWCSCWGYGIARVDDDDVNRYTHRDGLVGDNVTDVLRDRQGNLWVGDSHGGLTCIEPGRVQEITDEPIRKLLHADAAGRLWYDVDISTLRCLPPTGASRSRRFEFCCHCLAAIDGGWWIGSPPNGLYRWEGFEDVWQGPAVGSGGDGDDTDPTFVDLSGAGPFDDHHPFAAQALLADGDTLWIGAGWEWARGVGYLGRLQGGELQTIDTPHPMVTCLARDRLGRLWMGGWQGGGLSRYGPAPDGRLDPARLTTFTRADGFPADFVETILQDHDGRLWVVAHQEIYHFDPTATTPAFTAFGAAQGMPYLWYTCGAVAVDGQLWFGTGSGGVYRTDGRHLQRLTREDGLPGNSILNLTADPGGGVIVATSRGIVRCRPRPGAPPGIRLVDVVADRAYGDEDAITLTTTQADAVTFHFHGLDLSTRRMRYSYFLEGFDAAWRGTWERTARYERLPPGDYRFKVVAVDRDLVPSAAPATCALTVREDPQRRRIAELESALERIDERVAVVTEQEAERWGLHGFVARSPTMQAILADVRRLHQRETSVLITGESGTGKELIARAIHFGGERAAGPFLPLNCATVPRELAESTLFGHLRGAFSGAVRDRLGYFALADDGTLFLDEVSELPVDLQAKLLRVLEDGRFMPLGGTGERASDVRIVAATNVDLAERIADGRFRNDLYYRLARFQVTVPPLRERPEDVPLLVDHLLALFAADMGLPAAAVTDAGRAALQGYAFPGNVRELKNLIEHGLIASGGGPVGPEHLNLASAAGPPPAHASPATAAHAAAALPLDLRQAEAALVRRALERTGGNVTRAARLLGVSRKTVYSILQRSGETAGSHRPPGV